MGAVGCAVVRDDGLLLDQRLVPYRNIVAITERPYVQLGYVMVVARGPGGLDFFSSMLPRWSDAARQIVAERRRPAGDTGLDEELAHGLTIRRCVRVLVPSIIGSISAVCLMTLQASNVRSAVWVVLLALPLQVLMLRAFFGDRVAREISRPNSRPRARPDSRLARIALAGWLPMRK